MAGAGAMGSPASFLPVLAFALGGRRASGRWRRNARERGVGVEDVSGIEVRPTAPALGAEVYGTDIAEPLDGATVVWKNRLHIPREKRDGVGYDIDYGLSRNSPLIQ